MNKLIIKRIQEARQNGQRGDDLQQFIEAQFSFDEISTALYNALRAHRYRPDGSYCYRYIVAVYDTWFVYEETDCDGIDQFYKADYSLDAEGIATIGVPVLVREEVNYIPLTTADLAEAAKFIQGDCAQLIESASAGTSRRIKVKLIAPGWNAAKTAYYSEAMLKACAATAFPIGTQMFWNHPTFTESIERPERDLDYLAAVLVTTPVYEADNPKGPGPYAECKVFSDYQNRVDEMADWIGASIYAMGIGKEGEAEGIAGRIVEKLLPSPFNTVDFVTVPGAGGEIVQLFESARPGASAAKPPIQPQDLPTQIQEAHEGDSSMTPEEIQAMQDENKRLKEAQQRTAATDAARPVISEALAKIEMPQASRLRLTESLTKNAPLGADGQLDTAALATQVQEAATNELAYLQEAAGIGTGKIVGLGSSTTTTTKEAGTPAAIASMRAGMNLA